MPLIAPPSPPSEPSDYQSVSLLHPVSSATGPATDISSVAVTTTTRASDHPCALPPAAMSEFRPLTTTSTTEKSDEQNLYHHKNTNKINTDSDFEKQGHPYLLYDNNGGSQTLAHSPGTPVGTTDHSVGSGSCVYKDCSSSELSYSGSQHSQHDHKHEIPDENSDEISDEISDQRSLEELGADNNDVGFSCAVNSNSLSPSSSAPTSMKSATSVSTLSSTLGLGPEDAMQGFDPGSGSSTNVITRKSKAQSYRLLSTKTKIQQSAHIYPAHTKYVQSLLTREQNPMPNTSYAGFHHLAMIVLVASNIRLLVENFQRYGLIMTLFRLGISKTDVKTCIYLLALAPAHLFVALAIEKLANFRLHQNDGIKKDSKPHRPKHLWALFAFAHFLNALFVLTGTSFTVYYKIRHPLIGTICECHALILCMKIASYALVNRDLRYLAGYNDPSLIPELYQPNAYPKNLTLSNLIYFWWAPTLLYQPIYPMSAKIRWKFMFTRAFEMALIGVLIWFMAGQYAIPILEDSLPHFISGDVKGIVHSLLNLASVSIVIWLLGFVFLFQCYLNFLAEMLRFADRDFYQDWWNSGSVGAYWRLWNKPVSNYFKRHLYIPLLKRGYSPAVSQCLVFLVSAVLHEMLVGIPTKQIIGVAFACMILQMPLVLITAPLEKMRGPGTTIGNCIFWLSFFFGQPFAVLIYYYAWNVQHAEHTDVFTSTIVSSTSKAIIAAASTATSQTAS